MLGSNLEVNSEQIKLHLYQTNSNSEQPLLSLSYQLTDQQLSLSTLVNYANIKALLPSKFIELELEPIDELNILWLQNRLDKKFFRS